MPGHAGVRAGAAFMQRVVARGQQRALGAAQKDIEQYALLDEGRDGAEGLLGIAAGL
ncbi:hypothetical protein D3C85_1599810 [compost metagenome]